jgi:two-component system nitrate/nitrite response regulator NarL
MSQSFEETQALTHRGLSIIVSLPDEVTRCGLRAMLSSLRTVTATTTCANPQEAIELLSSRRFDVLILDANAKEETCKQIAAVASRNNAKVILLLNGTNPEQAAAVADTVPTAGFLLQNELTTEHLEDALTRLSDGGMPMPPELARRLLSYVHSANPAHSARPNLLSPRELQVLCLLAEGLSNKQIARRMSISAYSTKRHVANLLAKLNCPNRTMAVVMAMRQGLIKSPLQASEQ